MDITTQTPARRGRRQDRFGSLGNPKLAGLIGIVGLILTVLGLGIAYLSYRGDERERTANAGPTVTPKANVPHDATSSVVPPSNIPVPADEARTPGVDDTFDLSMRGGFAYDIDLERGQPLTNFGRAESDPGDPARDLYRSSFEMDIRGWQLYVPKAPLRDMRRGAFQVMSAKARATDCRKLETVTSQGSIDGSLASAGMKACIKTNLGKWAMITLIRLPQESDNLLHIKVTLLK